MRRSGRDASAAQRGRDTEGQNAKVPARQASATEHAVALVAARSWTVAALRERLARRYPETEVDTAIARLCELRLLDDAAWAERFVRDRFERSDQGRHRIRMELARRGLAAELIDATLDRVLDEDAERVKARAVLARLRARLDRGPGARTPATGDDDAARTESDSRSRVRLKQQGAQARSRLFRRMLARGHPANLVRDLLDVS